MQTSLPLAGAAVFSPALFLQVTMQDTFSLMIHGGAGALDNVGSTTDALRYLESMRVVCEFGRDILSRGGSALEAVETCASLLEDDPLFNAGAGSVLNEDGRVEMDAAIMSGRDLAAGAVAGASCRSWRAPFQRSRPGRVNI